MEPTGMDATKPCLRDMCSRAWQSVHPRGTMLCQSHRLHVGGFFKKFMENSYHGKSMHRLHHFFFLPQNKFLLMEALPHTIAAMVTSMAAKRTVARHVRLCRKAWC